MSADPAADLRDRAIAPLLAKLADGPSLTPVRPVEGDLFTVHPSGGVIVKVSPTQALWFDSPADYDEWTERIDRERAPGRDPWRPVVVR